MRGMARPCIATRTTHTNADMKSDRKNTISHAFAMDSERTSKPPVDQQIAPAIIMSTARRWRGRHESLGHVCVRFHGVKSGIFAFAACRGL